MTKEEIKARIRTLNKELETLKKKKKRAENEQEDLYDAIDKIRAKRREIESGLQKTLETIEHNLAKVNSHSLFRNMYREAAKEKLLNSDSSQAIDSCDSALKTALKKCSDTEDAIDDYKKKIKKTENTIADLKKKLKVMEAEDGGE